MDQHPNQRFTLPSLLSVLETIPLSLWIYQLDGLLIAMSRYGETFWGVQREEFVGTFNTLTAEASTETGSAEFFARAAKGEVYETAPALYDTRKMGVAHDQNAQVWVQRTVFPLYDEDGVVSHVVLMHRNVTPYMEQKQEIEAGRQQIVEQQDHDLCTFNHPARAFA